MTDLPGERKPMPEQTPARPRRGCLFYGCLTGIVCLLAILVAGLLGLHQLRRMLDKYTDTKPMPMPAVDLAPAQLEQLKRRVEMFRDDLRAGRSTAPLSLFSDEINALIQKDPDFKGLSGKVYFTIEGDRLKARISLPMQELGLPRFKGRYLNGTGEFSLALDRGFLDVRAQELSVKGHPLPRTYMEAIRKQNLAPPANDNPRASVGLNQLQEIQVRDGRVILVPKDNR